MMQSNSQKKKASPYVNNNLLESMRDIGSGVSSTISRDVAGGISDNVIKSIFGSGSPPSGEIRMNEPVTFAPERPPAPRTPEYRPVTMPKADTEEVKVKIDEIRVQLRILAKSVSTLNTEIQKAVIEAPVSYDVYHISYFEQLLSFLKTLKEKIDDSSAWLSAFTGRSRKKRGYWGLYKKHGTAYGLSSERSRATQTG